MIAQPAWDAKHSAKGGRTGHAAAADYDCGATLSVNSPNRYVANR